MIYCKKKKKGICNQRVSIYIIVDVSHSLPTTKKVEVIIILLSIFFTHSLISSL